MQAPGYYIGLDVHKRIISYCVKEGSGKVHAAGTIPATRLDLDDWLKKLPQPWSAAMEATLFTGWIYDRLKPHAAALEVVHPLMLRASPRRKRKTIASMPARSAIVCGVIFCRIATWLRRRSANGAARCAYRNPSVPSPPLARPYGVDWRFDWHHTS